MIEKNDSDLKRIKELWPGLPWHIKQKILFLAIYYMFCNQVNKAWEKVNLAWFRLMI